MEILSNFCSVVAVVTAVLLIIVVLIQDNKSGGGLGGLTGGSDAMFGGETANVMVKFTTVLAIIFLIATLGKASIVGNSSVPVGDSRFADVPVEAASAPAETPAETPAE